MADPALVVAGAPLLGAATVTGAWLARRHADRREQCFGAAAGALLVIAGLHLLPDAWSAARAAGAVTPLLLWVAGEPRNLRCTAPSRSITVST